MFKTSRSCSLFILLLLISLIAACGTDEESGGADTASSSSSGGADTVSSSSSGGADTASSSSSSGADTASSSSSGADVVDPDVVDPDVVDPDVVDPDVVDPDVVDPDVVDLDVVDPDIVDLDVVDPDIVDLDVSDTTGPITACSEIGADECFSNYDCLDANDRCEDVGEEVGFVVCCVPGARGAGVAGDACTQEHDCASSICIDNLCSDTCTDVNDCPTSMQSCTPIAFSGDLNDWCFPAP